MSKVRLYKVLILQGFLMGEQGERWSLQQWSKNDAIYKGETVETREFLLPDGYTVSDNMIYDKNNICCELVTSDAIPVLVTADGFVELEAA